MRANGIDSIPASRFCFTDSSPLALAMAASGYGIALARTPTTNHLVEQLGLVPCAVMSAVQSSEAYYLVYQNVESLSPAAAAFRDWLLQAA